MRDRRRTLKNLLEVGIGAVLALACFLVLLGVLNLIFPGASPIGSLARNPLQRSADRAASLDLDGLRGGGGIARLRDVERAVRDRPPGSVIWGDAGDGTALGDHHAVQTLRRSSATIEFDASNRIDLGPDSLIVVRRPNRFEGSWTRRAAVQFVGGTLSGSLERGEDAKQVELHAAGRTIRAAEGSEATARFDLREDGRGGNVLSVRGGDAEMTDGEQTITIPADHVVRFDEQTVDEARPLPIAPRRVAPADGARYVYRELPPRVEFAWRRRAAVRPHRLRIARDAAFADVVLETETDAGRFAHGTLRAGTYSWQVAAVVDGIEGEPSASGRFEIVQDLEPPPLELELAELSAGGALELRGITEPRATVFVGDEPVPTAADGRFSHRMPLRRGVNFVVIQAVDEAGNTTFRTREVSTGTVVGRRSR